MDLKAMNAALAGLCAKYAVVTPGEPGGSSQPF